MMQMGSDPIPFVKAHAYGNDFLLVEERAVADADRAAFARAICDRHRGVGGDGLLIYRQHGSRAAMALVNADGSPSELSGNGVRCLAALVARSRPGDGGAIAIETDAGPKELTLLERAGAAFRFRASMGQPANIRMLELDVDGERMVVTALTVGNPQCVRLVARLDAGELHRLGARLSRHAAFPEGTNVEFAQVDAPDRLRILIWERGVGPTESSGTGSCAAAVAAAVHGGTSRDVEIVAPGGSQRVEWRDEGLYLTGWAELVADGQWLPRAQGRR
jgi:diaminopimelate epimerase